ncbi:MAG: dihydrofolate reductase family protein, partial [Steroidobacteraceae bacterium]
DTLRTPPEARVVNREGHSLIIATRDDVARRAALEAAGAAVAVLPAKEGRADLRCVLERLASMEMNEIWVECGATLAGSLLQQRLVDEFVVYMAPAMLGPDARALAALPVLLSLDAKLQFSFTDVRSIGPDLRITMRPA